MSIVYGVVQRCDNGHVLPYSGISDGFGNYATTDANGLWYSTVAYPGYVVTASHSGFYNKSHPVTSAEIKAAWVTICLDEKPKDTTSCFTAETKILMADGYEIPISRIKIGDMVMGGALGINRVTGIERPILGDRLLYSLNDSSYFFTAEHPFRANKTWKAINPTATARENPNLEVGRLKLGDTVERIESIRTAAISGNLALAAQNHIESITIVGLNASRAEPKTPLYNLLLDGDNTYFANGFLVHNKNGW